MRRWLLAATAVYLAACGNPASDSSTSATGPTPGDPGTYTRTLEDGTPVALVIREDGSLLRIAGKARTTGTVSVDGDKTCFTFSNDAGKEYCWTNGPIGADGTFESTGPEGEVLTLTYSPEVSPKGMTMVPGTYEVGNEKTAYGRAEIRADGTYTDFANGKPVGNGTWSAQDERTCFDPEGEAEHQKERCWINSPADENGRALTTREDGSESYYVTPVYN